MEEHIKDNFPLLLIAAQAFLLRCPVCALPTVRNDRVRLRCSVPSSATVRLPRSPIAAPTALALDSATGSGQARAHSLASFLPPPAAVGSLPIKG